MLTDGAHDGRSFVHVGKFQTYAGGSARTKERSGVFDVYDAQSAVEFVVSRINEPHHRHLLHARHETRGGDIAFRDDERYLVAGTDAKLSCEITPENDAETAGLEFVDRTHANGRRNVAHRRFGSRIYAANHGALDARSC